MKIYTKVILDWNPSTEQYEETYAESYNYEGEVALCQRVGYTGENLNEVLDRILSGIEAGQRGKEATRQFDVNTIMNQKKIEQGDKQLEIQDKNADASIASAENTSKRLDMALTRQDIESDNNTLLSWEAITPETTGQWEAKVKFGQSLIDAGDIHQSLMPRLQQGHFRSIQGLESHNIYNDIITDSKVTSDALRAFSRTGTTEEGTQVILNPNQRKNLINMADDRDKNAIKIQYTNFMEEQLQGMGYSEENPQYRAIMSSVNAGNYQLASNKFKQLGGDLTLVQANEGMTKILNDAVIDIDPNWGIKEIKQALRLQGVPPSDISMFEVYWDRAHFLTPQAATAYGPYSKEAFTTIKTMIVNEHDKMVKDGQIDPDTRRPMQSRAFTDAQIVRIAQARGLAVDDEGNIVTGEQKPPKVSVQVQGVNPGSTYIVKTDHPRFRKDLSKAPLSIVHSNNMEGEVIVDRIGSPVTTIGYAPKGPVAGAEPHVFFRDSQTNVSYDIPISYFNQYFVERSR